MIGGSGEKKTIPLAAKYFDHLNIIAGFDELPRKVQVVKERCEEIGRDPATLETSMLVIGGDRRERQRRPDPRQLEAASGRRWPRTDRRPDQTKVLDAGVDGVILSPVTNLNGYQPGGISPRWPEAEAACRRLNRRRRGKSHHADGNRAATVVTV